MYDEKVMPKAVDRLVVALCADYFRRKRLIERGGAPYTVIMECRYLNYRIYDAAFQIVGGNAEPFIRDIGDGVGYASSGIVGISESTYKKRKAEVKRSIARRLALF